MPQNATIAPPALFPIALGPELLIESFEGLAEVVVNASEQQVAEKDLVDDDEAMEFRLGCDGLNFRRVYWRVCEEQGVDELEHVGAELSQVICRMRGYDPDEFELAKTATRDRTRLPFGMLPLELAYARTKRRKFKLKHDDLKNSRVCNLIAGMAMELQTMRADLSTVILPVEQIREIVSCKKLLVSGSLIRLVEYNILEDAKTKYHTGRAREYRFIGKEGEDYEVEG